MSDSIATFVIEHQVEPWTVRAADLGRRIDAHLAEQVSARQRAAGVIVDRDPGDEAG